MTEVQTPLIEAGEDRQPKRYWRGTHRLLPPEETWARISPLLPDFGITRVADVTGLDEVGIPVFQAVRPEGHIIAVSQGKGVSPELARISAAMEAIEGWHAERVRPGVVRGSARRVGPLPYELSDLALAPRSLVSGDLVLDWLDAVGLVSGHATVVPRDLVTLSKLVRPGWEPPTFAASSNGLGSGNSLVEATLHGLYEVIESDCLSRAAAVPLERRRCVDVHTIDDPVCRDLLALLAASKNAAEVYDITTELGVPCFTATIVSSVLPRRFSGAGCHLEARVALARALTEAAQARLVAIAGARDDLPDQLYAPAQPPTVPRTPTAVGVPFNSATSAATDTLEEDLTLLAGRVCDCTGIEPLLVDLSHSARGVPVVMAIAPRLACGLDALGFPAASG